MRNRYTFVAALLAATVLAGCRSPEAPGRYSTTKITSEDIDAPIALLDAAFPLSDVRDAAVVPGGFILASAQNAGVSLFNTSGARALAFGTPGEGPGEYKEPTAVAVDDSVVHVWDSGSRKLLSFGLKGEFLNESQFVLHASDFAVWDTSAVMYHAGSSQGFVSVSDLQGERQWIFGHSSFQDLLLGMMVGAGRVAMFDGFAWFARPAGLQLYRLDLRTWSVDSVAISDDAFEVATPVHVDDRQDIVSKWSQSVAYMSTNSRVVGVHQLGKNVAVEIEHGALPYADDTTDTRWSRVHIYDQQMEWVQTLEFPADIRRMLGGAIVASDSDCLYFVRPPAETNDQWSLMGVRTVIASEAKQSP